MLHPRPQTQDRESSECLRFFSVKVDLTTDCQQLTTTDLPILTAFVCSEHSRACNNNLVQRKPLQLLDRC